MRSWKKGIFCLLLFASFSVRAQETMITEISYPYLDTLIRVAKENYPRVKAMEKRVEIAQNNISRARISWLDAVNLSYLYNPNNYFNFANPSFFSGFQFGVNLNVGTLLQKPYQIRNAKEEKEVARFERDEYFLNLEALVKERYFVYIQQRTIVKARLQTAQDAESILKAVRYRFERGEETLQNYNNALIAFSGQNQQKISAESEMLVAKARLEELLGKKLEDIR